MSPDKDKTPPFSSPAIVQQMVDNQTKELLLRETELKLKKDHESHNFEFAKKALEAQQKDRSEGRNKWAEVQRYRWGYALASLVVVLIIAAYAMHIGKEAIIMEVVKAALFYAAGGASFYYVGKIKGGQQKDEMQDK